MFVLMTLASLRFCDTRDVSEFNINDSAVFGVSVDHKSKNAELMAWAAPKSGFATDSLWLAPISKLWVKIQPKEGCFTYMFPLLGPTFSLVSRRVATNGTAQAVLTALERKLGFKIGARLHSPRNFFATCAGQLRFSREEREREKLGRWAPGSIMPERYDRAGCVTELRIRSDIVSRILTEGWMPEPAFSAGSHSAKVPVKTEPDSQVPKSQSSEIDNAQFGGKIEDLASSPEASSTSEEEVDIADLPN